MSANKEKLFFAASAVLHATKSLDLKQNEKRYRRKKNEKMEPYGIHFGGYTHTINSVLQSSYAKSKDKRLLSKKNPILLGVCVLDHGNIPYAVFYGGPEFGGYTIRAFSLMRKRNCHLGRVTEVGSIGYLSKKEAEEDWKRLTSLKRYLVFNGEDAVKYTVEVMRNHGDCFWRTKNEDDPPLDWHLSGYPNTFFDPEEVDPFDPEEVDPFDPEEVDPFDPAEVDPFDPVFDLFFLSP
jgi:hypothetical protein